MVDHRTARSTMLVAGAAVAGLLVQTAAYADTAVTKPTVANGAAPRVVGVSNVGQTLSVTPGTWTSSAPYTLSYVWQRCTPAQTGATCETIPGATDPTYTITAADHYTIQTYSKAWMGTNQRFGYPYRMQAAVTATNAAGSTTVYPSATTPVMENSTMIGGTGGSFDTMIENKVTKPMTTNFDVIMSQWNRHCPGGPADPNNERITFLPSDRPGAQPGDQMINFTIKDGDTDPMTYPISHVADRQRCEVMSYQQLREGADTWTRFQVKLGANLKFDPSWNTTTNWYKWQAIWDLHLGRNTGSGPIGLAIRSDSVTSGHFELIDGTTYIRVSPTQQVNYVRWRSGAVQLDHWYDMVVHVVSSASDSVGRIDLWIDGVQQTMLDGEHHHTLVEGDYTYPVFGLYRDSAIHGQSDVYGDGYRMGLTPETLGCGFTPTQQLTCTTP